MSSVPVPFRVIITAALSLSAVLAGVSRPLMASSLDQELARPHQDRRVCCCGTTDGRCCGMACCQTPKQEDKSPTSPNRTEDRGQPLGLTLAAAGQPIGPSFNGNPAATFAEVIASGIHSLIALSIRLNI